MMQLHLVNREVGIYHGILIGCPVMGLGSTDYLPRTLLMKRPNVLIFLTVRAISALFGPFTAGVVMHNLSMPTRAGTSDGSNTSLRALMA